MEITITVCIGSGCHVKGSRDIIEILKNYISQNELDIELELEACFCQGHCIEGVVVDFNGKIETGITKKNILPILEEKIETATGNKIAEEG